MVSKFGALQLRLGHNQLTPLSLFSRVVYRKYPGPTLFKISFYSQSQSLGNLNSKSKSKEISQTLCMNIFFYTSIFVSLSSIIVIIPFFIYLFLYSLKKYFCITFFNLFGANTSIILLLFSLFHSLLTKYPFRISFISFVSVISRYLCFVLTVQLLLQAPLLCRLRFMRPVYLIFRFFTFSFSLLSFSPTFSFIYCPVFVFYFRWFNLKKFINLAYKWQNLIFLVHKKSAMSVWESSLANHKCKTKLGHVI